MECILRHAALLQDCKEEVTLGELEKEQDNLYERPPAVITGELLRIQAMKREWLPIGPAKCTVYQAKRGRECKTSESCVCGDRRSSTSSKGEVQQVRRHRPHACRVYSMGPFHGPLPCERYEILITFAVIW